MEIKTKFNVHDLTLANRSNYPGDTIIVFEIMEVISQTCYTGTQIFYLTRAIVCTKEQIRPYSENNFKWKIDIAHGRDIADVGWKRYREDELIPASKVVMDIIEGTEED